MNKRTAQKQQRRDHIIDVAKQLFLQRGIHNVQLQEIASEAGIGIATLYRYFPNKEQLVFAVNNTIITQMVEAIAAIHAQPINAYEKIEQVFNYYIQLAEERDHQFVRFMKAFESYKSTNIDHDDAKEYADNRLALAHILLQLVEGGRTDGSLRTDVDLNLYIITAVQNISTFMTETILTTHDPALPIQLEPKTQLTLMKDMFLQYVGANR